VRVLPALAMLQKIGYQVNESLRFGDVELFLPQSSTPATVQNLRGKVTLRFTKNKK
jgi:hypothetical protein